MTKHLVHDTNNDVCMWLSDSLAKAVTDKPVAERHGMEIIEEGDARYADYAKTADLFGNLLDLSEVNLNGDA